MTAASHLQSLLQILLQRSLPQVWQETTQPLPMIYNPARSRGKGGISGKAGKPRHTPPLRKRSRDLECLDGATGKSALRVSSTGRTGMTQERSCLEPGGAERLPKPRRDRTFGTAVFRAVSQPAEPSPLERGTASPGGVLQLSGQGKRHCSAPVWSAPLMKSAFSTSSSPPSPSRARHPHLSPAFLTVSG